MISGRIGSRDPNLLGVPPQRLQPSRLLAPNMLGGPGHMMPAQAPQQPRQANPYSLEGIGGAFQNLQKFARDNPAAMAALGAGIASGNTAQGMAQFGQFAQAGKSKNATVAWLDKVDPGMAEYVRNGGDVKTAMTIAAAKVRKTAGGNEYGLNPQYGVDADGNPVLIQIGKDGRAIRTQMPENVALRKKPIEIDAGTHTILLDPITRQPIGQIKKENYQSEFDKASGKVAGTASEEAKLAAPKAIAKADESIALIDGMLKHPGRETATGLSSVVDPRNYLAGTDATDFNVRRKQLEGRAFLEAFESLKGGGHITEIEGQKATEAMARLDTAQSDEEYIRALEDLKEVMQAGKRRAMTEGGMTVQPDTQTPTGGTDTTINGQKARIRRVK